MLQGDPGKGNFAEVLGPEPGWLGAEVPAFTFHAAPKSLVHTNSG